MNKDYPWKISGWEESRGVSGGVSDVLLFLFCVAYMGVLAFWKFMKLYIYDLCTFLYMLYFYKKLKEKISNPWFKEFIVTHLIEGIKCNNAHYRAWKKETQG